MIRPLPGNCSAGSVPSATDAEEIGKAPVETGNSAEKILLFFCFMPENSFIATNKFVNAIETGILYGNDKTIIRSFRNNARTAPNQKDRHPRGAGPGSGKSVMPRFPPGHPEPVRNAKGGTTMNIREFAAHCKLSIASVSRALNNPPETAQMSRKTYDYVHAEARELGYRPNYHARAFHTHRSGCVGIIGGSSMKYIGIALLEGIADVLDDRGIATYLASTRDEIEREAGAFDRMFYRNVDAIIHMPALQEGEYRTDRLAGLLKNNPGHPPILSILGGAEIPGTFRLRMKDAEAGREAALRQLKLGCRRFGVIGTLRRSPAENDGIRAYRNTLFENGVSPLNIREISIRHNFPDSRQEELRDIDGAWIVYYLLVPTCFQVLRRVCDPKKLHIDTVSTLENRELLLWLQLDADCALSIRDHFASLNIFQYSVYRIGVQTGETVVKLINAPALKPYTQELEWNQFLPGITGPETAAPDSPE